MNYDLNECVQEDDQGPEYGNVQRYGAGVQTKPVLQPAHPHTPRG